MFGTAYFLQATLIISWWLALFLSPNAYAFFEFKGMAWKSFSAFLLPDVLIIAVLSQLRAYWDKKELQLIILGGFAYATLFCINASLNYNSGYLSSLFMVAGLAYNLILCFPHSSFRVNTDSSYTKTALKTILQIICFWSCFLIIIPLFILKTVNTEIKSPDPLLLNIGVVSLALFSLLGLSSAFFMVMDGEGTPLPIDEAKKLVIRGPYKVLRNPMAVAGIGQALSIAFTFTSIAIAIYALLGAVIWHFSIRTIEEIDLEKRFGQEYKDYRTRTLCWWPNFKNLNTKKPSR